ncbi:MAG: MBL fold metallo-hydrolase [Fimbriimonas sp.]|nr:MBL fold metallo-hydrolase [Fimbriimonas sp.]
MSEVVILGSGTSNGVPMLGVKYPPAFLANPKNHRSRASIMVMGPTGNLLVDCTPEMRLQVTGLGITEIEAVVITHTHADHIMGMDDLRSLCMRTKAPVTVYTLKHHEADIRRVFAYAFHEYPPGIVVPRFDLKAIPDVLQVGGLDVHSFVVDHGPSKVIGLRVNNLAYVTDVSHIPAEAGAKLHDLDILILDAVRYEPHPNHFHMARAIEVARAIGAKKTYFTHLSDDYDHDLVNKTLPETMELAYDGLRLAI